MRKPLLPTLVLLASAGLVALTGCTGSAEPAAEQTPASASPSSSSPSSAGTPSGTPTPPDDAGPGGQTVAASCAIANEAVLGVQSEVGQAFTALSGGDYAGAAQALSLIETQLGTALGEITNPEVGTALGDLNATVATVTAQVTDAAGGGTLDQATLQSSAAELQAGAERMQELCT